MSDFSLQLLPQLPPSQIENFSCGHVIPSENILTVVIPKGPKGKEMEFKFSGREDEGLVRLSLFAFASSEIFKPDLTRKGVLVDLQTGCSCGWVKMEELGATLSNACNLVPDGIVVFFPSYAVRLLPNYFSTPYPLFSSMLTKSFGSLAWWCAVSGQGQDALDEDWVAREAQREEDSLSFSFSPKTRMFFTDHLRDLSSGVDLLRASSWRVC